MIVLLPVLAGGAGAAGRFAADGAIKARVGDAFPWSTLVINVTGSLVLGVLTGLALRHGAPGDLRTVLGTGFCGGYTTFGTASVETVRLARRGSWTAFGYAVGGLTLALGAAAVGLAVTR
jgi:fluoride exporter